MIKSRLAICICAKNLSIHGKCYNWQQNANICGNLYGNLYDNLCCNLYGNLYGNHCSCLQVLSSVVTIGQLFSKFFQVSEIETKDTWVYLKQRVSEQCGLLMADSVV